VITTTRREVSPGGQQGADSRAGQPPLHLTFRQRRALGLRLFRRRCKEALEFDSALLKKAAGMGAYLLARGLWATGDVRRGFSLFCKLHRGDFLARANSRVERLARGAVTGEEKVVLDLYQQHVECVGFSPLVARLDRQPEKLLGSIALVLKSPRADEKGVLLLQYSYTFPLFARRFDLQKVASRYHIVLEPDWSGFCDPNILLYSRYPFPVFVQAFEPRDAQFITNLRSNLVVVPTSTNWWVDHRLFRPLPGAEKAFDLVMVAAWGAYKRHHRFFRALGRLKRKGYRARALLLGYPVGLTKEDLYREAAYYGITDQLEFHEWVPYEKVNEFVNRAKVNIIWSRKEGVNRAIIEGMFAGVPCLVREGFNYGYHYPYINAQTGCFAAEDRLPERLLWMIENYQRFNPREWVAANMTCQRSTEILAGVIAKSAAAQGEPWTGGLAVKVNKLHNMDYWEPEDARRFEPDYQFLRSAIRA
jgi:glycosyltransferase involved in cell wall biosynthesis